MSIHQTFQYRNKFVFYHIIAMLGNNFFHFSIGFHSPESCLIFDFHLGPYGRNFCPFQLYKEPMMILKMPISTEANPAQMAGPFRYGESYRLSGLSPAARKLNGRLTIAETGMEQQQELEFESTRKREGSSEAEKVEASIFETSEAGEKKERLSDEKIIAEILKPAEMLQIAKSSTKLFKVTGTNTAIGLD